MKIFATADIHGNRVIMDKLNDIVDEVDLILICGDICGKDIRGKTFMQFSEYQKEVSVNRPTPSKDRGRIVYYSLLGILQFTGIELDQGNS